MNMLTVPPAVALAEIEAKQKAARKRLANLKEWVPSVDELPSAKTQPVEPAPQTTLPPPSERFALNSFRVGPSNAVAHGAVRHVLDNPPDRVFNPLYIHAGNGLGKTHLLHAAVRDAQAAGSNAAYVSASRVANDLAMLRGDTLRSYRAAFLRLDLIAVDDFHMMRSRAGMVALCDLLAELSEARWCQIIVAADRRADDIPGLEPAAVSRLGGGLVTSMGPMDESVAFRVLKAATSNLGDPRGRLQISDDVAHLILKNYRSGRTIQAAVSKLSALRLVSGENPTLDEATTCLAVSIAPDNPGVSIDTIKQKVAEFYGVSIADIISHRSTASIVKPRHVAFYLSKTMTLRSLPAIGRRFGGRDHTTILHGVRKIEALLKTNAQLAEEVNRIRKVLGSGVAS